MRASLNNLYKSAEQCVALSLCKREKILTRSSGIFKFAYMCYSELKNSHRCQFPLSFAEMPKS